MTVLMSDSGDSGDSGDGASGDDFTPIKKAWRKSARLS
jgi:hypothetical protein